MKLANAKNFADVKRRLTNAFSEKGAEAASALRDLIDELEASEVEYDVDEFKAAVEELIANYGDVPEAVAEAIAKKVQHFEGRPEGQTDQRREEPDFGCNPQSSKQRGCA